jgi:hypothetical protein
VAEQAPLVRDPELRSVGELPDFADVMEQRRRHQQVGVEPRVKLADLADEGPDCDGVLQQPADVGVMSGPGAGCPPEPARHRLREQDPLDHLAERRVVHLARQVLEEALQFCCVAVGGREEEGRVEVALRDRLDVLDLRDQLAAETLDLAQDPDRIAALEPRAEAVDVPKGAGRDRSAAVAQLQ